MEVNGIKIDTLSASAASVGSGPLSSSSSSSSQTHSPMLDFRSASPIAMSMLNGLHSVEANSEEYKSSMKAAFDNFTEHVQHRRRHSLISTAAPLPGPSSADVPTAAVTAAPSLVPALYSSTSFEVNVESKGSPPGSSNSRKILLNIAESPSALSASSPASPPNHVCPPVCCSAACPLAYSWLDEQLAPANVSPLPLSKYVSEYSVDSLLTSLRSALEMCQPKDPVLFLRTVSEYLCQHIYPEEYQMHFEASLNGNSNTNGLNSQRTSPSPSPLTHKGLRSPREPLSHDPKRSASWNALHNAINGVDSSGNLTASKTLEFPISHMDTPRTTDSSGLLSATAPHPSTNDKVVSTSTAAVTAAAAPHDHSCPCCGGGISFGLNGVDALRAVTQLGIGSSLPSSYAIASGIGAASDSSVTEKSKENEREREQKLKSDADHKSSSATLPPVRAAISSTDSAAFDAMAGCVVCPPFHIESSPSQSSSVLSTPSSPMTNFSQEIELLNEQERIQSDFFNLNGQLRTATSAGPAMANIISRSAANSGKPPRSDSTDDNFLHSSSPSPDNRALPTFSSSSSSSSTASLSSSSLSSSSAASDRSYFPPPSASFRQRQTQDPSRVRRIINIRLDSPLSLTSHLVLAKRYVAMDIGGSLTKVTIFEPDSETKSDSGLAHAIQFLHSSLTYGSSGRRDHSLSFQFGSGRFHFLHFLTRRMNGALRMFKDQNLLPLIQSADHRLYATGGGAYKFSSVFEKEIAVKIEKRDEMLCLLTGLNFLLQHVDDECYFLATPKHPLTSPKISFHVKAHTAEAKASGPAPANVATAAATAPSVATLTSAGSSSIFPYLLVNIGSGVSILRVDSEDQFERVGGSCIGGGSYLGLCRMITGANSFEEAMSMCVEGDFTKVDMLVGDIYGEKGYNAFNLDKRTVASAFGKLVMAENPRSLLEKGRISKEDIAASLLHMIGANIAQLAYLTANKEKVSKILFCGNFLRQNLISSGFLAYAIDYWSNGSMKALFLKHEGYFGSLGALFSPQ